jgi:hypothetical protein
MWVQFDLVVLNKLHKILVVKQQYVAPSYNGSRIIYVNIF